MISNHPLNKNWKDYATYYVREYGKGVALALVTIMLTALGVWWVEIKPRSDFEGARQRQAIGTVEFISPPGKSQSLAGMNVITVRIAGKEYHGWVRQYRAFGLPLGRPALLTYRMNKSGDILLDKGEVLKGSTISGK